MSTDLEQAAEAEQTERRYIVRLAIQATARGPSDAVQEALDQVLRSGLESFTYSVDEVGRGAKFFVTPAKRAGHAEALYPSWGDETDDDLDDPDEAEGDREDGDERAAAVRRAHDDEEFHGNFLG